ncbi:hypothetical protein [Bacillus gaemokensis]|uniref:PARP catalytic domain-containing protein n=1 Tax=Bacillus gaemokensis TaxID=574375 RepID=A0A073KNG7_9BACI|nr:hypothetical protein [Bacillus gaemokensis]KEK23913.1 hypothetical protein BAGA_05670 [Bacillus gaemokensis]KYG38036.1 hypothetical protein AZF08_19945 [Bacillus gaemokensis]
MGIYYHGTTLKNKDNIIRQGFIIGELKSSHSIGNGIYLTDLKDMALKYGEDIVTVEIDDSKIIEFENYGQIQNYIYEKTGNIEVKYLKNCLLSDDKIGVKHEDMVVIYDTHEINIIG